LTRELAGVGNLMWGNDYPHRDSTWPVSQQVLEEIFAGVPESDRRRMTIANAANLYRLDEREPAAAG
jgi:predicted TIM-barrel fold metal-dependent hydrolase